MVTPQLAQQYFAQHREAILADWFELLRIPTIGIGAVCVSHTVEG